MANELQGVTGGFPRREGGLSLAFNKASAISQEVLMTATSQV